MNKIITGEKAYDYAKLNFPVFPSDWYITANFSWNEAFKNELKSYGVPLPIAFKSIEWSATEFQKVREIIAKPMIIHCWYRGPSHNAALAAQGLKPAKYSSHLYGYAIDFHVPGMDESLIRAKLLQEVKKGNLHIRIESNTKGWVHVDIGNPTIKNSWGMFYI